MKRNRMGLEHLTAPTAIALGAVIAMLVGLLLMAAISYLLVNGHIALEAMNVITPVIQFVSMLVGSLITARVSANKAIIVPMMTCLIVVLTLMGCNILLIEEGMRIPTLSVVSFVAAVALNLMPIITKTKQRKTKIRAR